MDVIVDIIRTWMTYLRFSDSSHWWFLPYYSTMSDWDNVIIFEAFKIDKYNNTGCIILITTNVYGMGIDNPDFWLVIQ